MKTTGFPAALLLLTVSPLLGAAPINEICYSAAFPFNAAPSPTNATQFTCPISGVGTLPQFAAQGLRIVKLIGVSGSNSTIQFQLVVKTTHEILKDGFE